MAELYYVGSTSQTIDLFIQDSSSTTGGGLTGLAYNTSGLTAYYRKGATGTATAVTLATQTVGGAWSSGGFVEIDATNKPGEYRFDIPDALLDTEGLATITFRGAANMVACRVRIDCRSVRSDVRKLLGTAWLTPAVAGTPDVNAKQFGGAPVTATTSVTIPAASTLATTTGAVGSVAGNVGGNVTGSVGSISGVTFPTNFGDLAIEVTTGYVSANVVEWLGTAPATPTVAGVPEVDVTHVNGSVATGSGTPDVNVVSIANNAITAASLAADAGAEIGRAVWDVDISGDLTSGLAGNTLYSNVYTPLANLVNDIGANGSGLTALPWNAAWDAEVQSECTDALNAYDPPTSTEMTTAFTEIKGATWATTDTLEAIRDRGDAAWTTATGFSTHSAADVITALGSGTEVFGHSYLESIKRIEVVAGAATLSGAGTGTEVMTSSDSSKTATFTADSSGNVSSVVWA